MKIKEAVFREEITRQLSKVKKRYFKKKDFLVIECGNFNLKAALFSFSNTAVEVKDVWVKKIYGFSSEERKEVVVSLIKDNFDDEAVKNLKTLFIVPESDFIVRRLTIPFIPPAERAAALKLHLKGDISWDIEKTVLAWRVVQQRIDSHGTKKLDVIASFLLKNKVDEVLDICVKAGLSCYGIHSKLFSLPRTLSVLNINETVGVLDMGGLSTSFMILKKNMPLFLRKISFSCLQLTEAVRESREGGVSFDEAEDRKNKCGLSGEVFSYLRSHIEMLISEVKESIEYYRREFEDTPLSKIYLLGGGARLKGLEAVLGEGLGLEIKNFPLEGRELNKKLDREEASLYVPALLGAVYERSANFLPQELRASVFEEIAKVLLKATPPLLMIVFIFLFLNVNFQLNNLKSSLRSAEVHIGALRNVRSIKDEIKAKDTLWHKLRRSYIPADWILKSLSAHLPPEIILDKLSLDSKQAAVFIEGHLPDISEAEEIVVGYSQNLRKAELFKEVNLLDIVKTAKGLRKVATFRMNCRLIKF